MQLFHSYFLQLVKNKTINLLKVSTLVEIWALLCADHWVILGLDTDEGK